MKNIKGVRFIEGQRVLAFKDGVAFDSVVSKDNVNPRFFNVVVASASMANCLDTIATGIEVFKADVRKEAVKHGRENQMAAEMLINWLDALQDLCLNELRQVEIGTNQMAKEIYAESCKKD